MGLWTWLRSAVGLKVGYGSAERTIVDASGSLTPKDIAITETRSGAGSYQSIAADLTLHAAAGTSEAGDTDYLAPVMGNVLGDQLTRTNNYIGGVIGAYSVTGRISTTYPAGAVLAQITDGVTYADGAVVAYIDGDGAQTTANAAFKARMRNSTPGSGFDYGVDLHDPAEGAYNALAIHKADLRLSNEVCVLSGEGAPVNGATGSGYAGPCSFYLDRTNANVYINAGTKESPAWKLVTRAV